MCSTFAKEMKFPRLGVIWILVFLLAACSESTNSIKSDQTDQAALMRKIHYAVLEYENLNGDYPDTLDDLITSNLLKKEEITIRRSDGKMVRPTYYPNPKLPSDALLVFDLHGTSDLITINVDGSIH
jgi:hypothetical protein